MIELEAMTFEIHRTADEIDRRPVPVHDPAGKASDRRVIGHRRGEVAQPGFFEPHVIVEEGDPRMVRGLRRTVVSLGESKVPLERDNADARVAAPNVIDRPIV